MSNVKRYHLVPARCPPRGLAALGALALACAAHGQLIAPPQVPGKEYSNHQDENAFGIGDFLQNIHWDGLGGAFDTFDYSGSAIPPWNAPIDPDQVDALANHQDFLFSSVAASITPFVTSFSGIGDIHYHHTNGATGIWAFGPVDINAGAPPDDVDGLELWGRPDENQHNGLGTDDANHYSIIGDALGPGISVFYYDPNLHASMPYIFHNQLQAALGVSFQVDVDALMVSDAAGDAQWGPGDSIIFSLHPNVVHDGGEIWLWNFGAAPQFLVHGGITWDTANPVGQIFGVPTENINAFETVTAVPAPSALMLLGLGILAGVRRRR